jgi:hypothetical protein
MLANCPLDVHADGTQVHSTSIASPFKRERGRVRDCFKEMASVGPNPSPSSSPLAQGERHQTKDDLMACENLEDLFIFTV